VGAWSSGGGGGLWSAGYHASGDRSRPRGRSSPGCAGVNFPATYGLQPGVLSLRPGRAAEKGDERASLHSITSSARNRKASGIVRSIALAALRLMIRLNRVGTSTGRSAGLAPFRILSTKVANRR